MPFLDSDTQILQNFWHSQILSISDTHRFWTVLTRPYFKQFWHLKILLSDSDTSDYDISRFSREQAPSDTIYIVCHLNAVKANAYRHMQKHMYGTHFCGMRRNCNIHYHLSAFYRFCSFLCLDLSFEESVRT